MNKTWDEATKWEEQWWGKCTDTGQEEAKQRLYAEKMGLKPVLIGHRWYYDAGENSVLDVGSGPVSILLKCVNFHVLKTVAVDPLMDKYPLWVRSRYRENNITPVATTGEAMMTKNSGFFDEAWIYNVLQHTISPKTIVKNMKAMAKVVRVFEWVDTAVNVGHPHSLKEEKLNKWFGGEGKVEMVDKNGAKGKAYFGVFKGDDYEV